MFNGYNPLIIYVKRCTLDVWQGSKYASENQFNAWWFVRDLITSGIYDYVLQTECFLKVTPWLNNFWIQISDK